MSKQLTHPSAESIALEGVLYALSDPVRLSIVRLAAEKDEQPCNAFTDTIAKSTLSHHWKVLRDSGLIRQTQRGTQRLNSLRKEEIDQLYPGLLDAILHVSK